MSELKKVYFDVGAFLLPEVCVHLLPVEEIKGRQHHLREDVVFPVFSRRHYHHRRT